MVWQLTASATKSAISRQRRRALNLQHLQRDPDPALAAHGRTRAPHPAHPDGPLLGGPHVSTALLYDLRASVTDTPGLADAPQALAQPRRDAVTSRTVRRSGRG